MGTYIKPTPFNPPTSGLTQEWRRILENIARTVMPMWKHPVLDMTLLEGVALNAATTLVPHGLGRKWRGWYVVDQLKDYRVVRSDSPTALAADPTLYIPLVALSTPAPLIVSLVVF